LKRLSATLVQTSLHAISGLWLWLGIANDIGGVFAYNGWNIDTNADSIFRPQTGIMICSAENNGMLIKDISDSLNSFNYSKIDRGNQTRTESALALSSEPILPIGCLIAGIARTISPACGHHKNSRHGSEVGV
jgi:hypothetical protein